MATTSLSLSRFAMYTKVESDFDLPKFSKFQVVIFTWLDANCMKNKKNNKRLFIEDYL
jgi:hypothetical protein